MSDQLSDPIKTWVEAEARGTAMHREREIRALLQPKPTWFPKWLWRRAVARLLALEERPWEPQK